MDDRKLKMEGQTGFPSVVPAFERQRGYPDHVAWPGPKAWFRGSAGARQFSAEAKKIHSMDVSV